MNIRDCNFSIRALSCLKDAKIDTLEQLSGYTANELLRFRNFGMRTIKEVREVLAKHNLKLNREY